jgi:hypothetical protein
MVHDRFVSNDAGDPQSNPFLLGQTGPGGIQVDRDFANGPDLDVIPPGSTLVISGPHGTIDNTSLDGGNYSNHGFAVGSSLPASATRILSAGPNSNNVAAFSYPLGSGAVYYSTIPLDWYLDGSGPNPPQDNFATIYTPNVLTYGDTLNPAPASDWYSVTALGGATLNLLTTTPGDGLGQPANGLDPHIELYGPDGAFITAGNPAQRNEAISYTVPAGPGGIYRIRVTAQGGTTGEYFLDPIQTVPPPPPLPLLVAATAKSRKAGTAASSSPLASAAASQKQPARQSSLDAASVDALFAGADPAARKSPLPQPKARVADSLLDLVASSVTRGKKGSARARH